MNELIRSAILTHTGANSLVHTESIQELWSGYGEILRVWLSGLEVGSVIVKHVHLSDNKHHPRGWNTDLSHQRKVHSYQVETTWYEQYSKRSVARLPECLAIQREGEQVIIILEDLDEAGFPLRKQSLSWKEIDACLSWLASFHATYLGEAPTGLWTVGTYWHLETRPQELAALNDEALKSAAHLIDQKLNSCKYQTFVHGDAKLANFCFAPDGQVAGVDFQYVGGGCGMKDVAYFIGSCLSEQDCERLESRILDCYFGHLQRVLSAPHPALEAEWRSLYHVAWADFHRFLKGWSPGHWKINSYSERITQNIIDALTP